MHPKSAARIQTIPETIFATMSALAVEHNAVNLGQGFPDFDGPGWIIEEAYQAMKAAKNQYAPLHGTRTLREAVAGYYAKSYGIEADTEREITVTSGATEALYASITALIDPGDEALMFEPFYDAHQANVLLAGGTPKYITLHKPDFTFRTEELERLISPNVKLLILNNPQNPLGKVFTREELETLASYAVENDWIVISDEVYEFLTYDDAEHIPIATLPGMRERTITISSTGKTFGLTGWKIGYAVAPPELTAAIRKVHQFTTFAVNTPGQIAMGHALGRLDKYLPEFREQYARKRNMLHNGLLKGQFAPHMPRGSYFMMVDIPSDLGMNDVELAQTLVKQHGVAVIPPSVFYGSSDEGGSMLRLCFAKTDATLQAGLEKLVEV
ncbi:MAG: aminotransferase [Ectothiorhodospiraceae bacterium]|nr:aminotransferase [Ectothiorhodospiraceae bacterium]